MHYVDDGLMFSFERTSNNNGVAHVTVRQQLIDAVYQQAIATHRNSIQTQGFARGAVLPAYVALTHRPQLIEHLKEFFLNYYVINHLCWGLSQHKLTLIGDPALAGINLDINQDACFSFSFAHAPLPEERLWLNASFKAPGRRNYKDLDRQVKFFLQEEDDKKKTFNDTDGIQALDWIGCSISILNDKTNTPTLPHESRLWLRIGREEIDKEAQDTFIGKKIGDTFVTTADILQHYFSQQLDTTYPIAVTITNVVSHAYFSLPLFKQHFTIASNTDIHKKFIEIFSTRHDISLRRETVECALKCLNKQYPFRVPDELIREQAKFVIKTIQQIPDYRVYRTQKDFHKKVISLSEKQLKDVAIIDHVASLESITVDQQDIVAYLNLLQRPRTREFVYFDMPQTQISGQEQPIPEGILYQACLREKTLNYIIKTLSRAQS